jgi:hypothetical protein
MKDYWYALLIRIGYHSSYFMHLMLIHIHLLAFKDTMYCQLPKSWPERVPTSRPFDVSGVIRLNRYFDHVGVRCHHSCQHEVGRVWVVQVGPLLTLRITASTKLSPHSPHFQMPQNM